MKYVTTIERMAEERGEERARVTTQTEIALNMLRDNLPLEQITRWTELTIAQIEVLQAETK
jgi:hypothetical protein